jgi:Skp family chaperone for outer membrane proteins
MSEKLTLTKKLSIIMDNNRQIIISLVFGVLSSLIVLGLYIFLLSQHHKPTVASVDVKTLMQEVTLSTFNAMDSTNEEKQAQVAADKIKSGAGKIEQALKLVAEKNNLILIQKQAFAYDSNVPDYTDEVRNEIKTLK